MTTGIDYTNQYLSLRPEDGSHSIAELVEMERTNGYSDMTNDEIARLIEYKEYCAKQDELIEQNRAHNEAMLKQAKEEAEKQRQETRDFFDKVINMQPALASVTGNEVE